MAKVRIRNEEVEFEVPNGDDLMPYAKKNSSMLFGCENGQCGTCVCSVSRGSENVNIKTLKEEQTLDKIKAYPSARLACQIKIKKGEVEIEY
jgi:2Fe-2S ferredoxin